MLAIPIVGAKVVPTIDGECEYEVEKILNRQEAKGVVHYLVKWRGWSRKHDSWEPEANLTNSADLIQEFEAALDFNHCPGMKSGLGSTQIL